MIDPTALLEVSSRLTTKSSALRYYGNSVYLTCPNTGSVLSCYTEVGNIRLIPLVIRLTYDTPPKHVASISRLASLGGIKSASISAYTRNSVSEILGNTVYLYGSDLEIFGKLRRSKTDRLYKYLTLATYVILCIKSIMPVSTCRDCPMRPINGNCSLDDCHIVKNLSTSGKR